MNMKAILLVRISSVSQQLDEQTNSLINYAQSKGYTEDNLIIIEDVESAIKLAEEERNGLNKMKAEISADKNINAVFVWELSRLTRKPTTAYSLRDYFNSNSIQLYCYSPQFQLLKSDLTDLDDTGSLLFALYIQMAEAEMRNKKARFHRSKIRNAKTGKYSGGFVKYGYTVNDNGYYEINEQEAEIIRYIFNEYEKGRSTMNLTKELKERGIINTTFFVRGILISEAYTGLSNQYGMSRIYPQIISVEQFNRCRELAKERNKKADKTNEIYYCKKLIKCTECGTHYIAMKSSCNYLCYGKYGKEAKIFPEKACKKSPIININVLDSLVWDLVIDHEVFKIDGDVKTMIKNINNQTDINNQKIANAKKQIEFADKKRERNNNMYFNGNIQENKYFSNSKLIDNDVKKYRNLITGCKNENKRLQERLNEIKLKHSLLDYANNRYEYLQNLQDDSEKYKIVKKHIREINILEEQKQTTKIVLIHYYERPSERYRIHIKKKPVLIEFDNTYKYNGKLPEIWQVYPLEITRRFKRISKKQKDSTTTD